MKSAKELNWCILYKKDPKEKWNLPFGFANEMEKQELRLKRGPATRSLLVCLLEKNTIHQ